MSLAAPAFAETHIGAAGTVVRDVTGKLETEVRTIAIRDVVFQNDLIETKDQSATELDSYSDVDVENNVGDMVILDHPDAAITGTPAGAFINANFTPAWADVAIRELDKLLSVAEKEDFQRAQLIFEPPPPAVVAVAPAPPPPPPPAEPEDGLGLGQAQSVASDNALGGGLVNSAVGRADTSAQGLGGSHGGGNSGGGSSSRTISSSGGDDSTSTSSSTTTRSKSAAAKSRGRGRPQE